MLIYALWTLGIDHPSNLLVLREDSLISHFDRGGYVIVPKFDRPVVHFIAIAGHKNCASQYHDQEISPSPRIRLFSPRMVNTHARA
jgi:hypothetical protein